MNKLPLALVVAWIMMGAAWLVPNHYPPWTSFHGDLVSAAGFAVLMLTVLARGVRGIRWPMPALAAIAAAAVPLLQAAAGQIFFWGDAWMATLYLLGFALAIVAGHRLVQAVDATDWLRVMWLTTTFAAIASVGIALGQWTSLFMGVFAADMVPGGRPFANLGQPNHLSTLCLLGLVSACALRQCGDIGGRTLALVAAYLGFGVVMSQSRTAYLGVAALLAWFWLSGRRAGTRITPREAIAAAVAFVALSAGWEDLCRVLDLPVGRTLAEQAGDNGRRVLWGSMARAILDAPLWGYGWNQVSVAQSRLALVNPPTGVMFEHSHNLVLDLLAWNGIPLGLAIAAGLAAWLWARLRRCEDPRAAYLCAAILVIVAHALTEYPLDYAYFLLPLGIAMGAAQALEPRDASPPRGPVLPLAATALAGALAVAVVLDYMKLEANYRQLRFESSRTGETVVRQEVPDVLVLTQLREFIRFARSPATRGMTDAQLAAMHRVVERFGYPSVQIRYALANALAGRPDVAADTLARLCKIHEVVRCNEGREAWQTAGETDFPELKRIPYPKGAAP